MSVTAGVPPSITTPDTVQSRLGTLEFNDGAPTPDTAEQSWRPSEIEAYSTGSNGHDPQTGR